MQTIAEHVTEQFYEWELRGRGHQLYDAPLEPEPPFIPFTGYRVDEYNAEAVDDGRQSTIASGLIEWCGSLFKKAPPRVQIDEFEEQYRLVEEDEKTCLSLVLPPGITYPKDVTEQFLLNLSQSSRPTCFELLAECGDVRLQLVVSDQDREIITTQSQNHFPEAIIRTDEDRLQTHANPQKRWSIVEFGLAHEFILPLRAYRSFAPDPLTGLIANLGSLSPYETGVVQIIFTPVRYPWASQIKRSLMLPYGEPLFSGSPEFNHEVGLKLASPLYGVVIRAAGQGDTPDRSHEIIRNIAGSLAVADKIGGNQLVPLDNAGYEYEDHRTSLLMRDSCRAGMILSLDELATFVHLPGASVVAPALVRNAEKTKLAPTVCSSGAVLLGANTHNGQTNEVYQPDNLRSRHTYVLGATGSGKTTLLCSMIAQDIAAGRGVGVLDPHGDLIDDILTRIPSSRVDDVVLLDLADDEYPIPFNILSAHSELEKNLLASDLAAAFKRLATSWGDQMTAVLANAILAILESPRGGTLADLRRFLVEPKFRASYLESVTDDEVIYYWQHEFGMQSGKPQGSVVTRLNTFLRPKPIRHMIAHGENRLDIGGMMNTGKIFLGRIPQGAIGEENSYLLGTLLVSAFHRSALCRQSTEASSRQPFHLYIDEFHHFITPSMTQILAGARKYGLGLILAHQELRQLESRDPDVASSVLANPATQILFRLGDADARRMDKQLTSFDAHDLQNLAVGQAVTRIERAEWDFNLSVPLPPEVPADARNEITNKVRERSRTRYAVPRVEVEAKLARGRTKRSEVKPGPIEAKPEADRDVPRKSQPKPSKKRRQQSPARDVVPVKLSNSAPAPSPPSQGRGGIKHKSIQRLIKHWAEGMGFRAQIEKTILEGRGAVDVALYKGDLSIGCEISVTTPTAHELGNLRKCLEAGFDPVVMVSEDNNHLQNIKSEAEKTLESQVFDRVSWLLPKDLFAFIEAIESEALEDQANTIRGYKVNINRSDTDAASRAARLSSVKKTIAKASTRRHGRGTT